MATRRPYLTRTGVFANHPRRDVGRLAGIPLFAVLSKKEREQVARWADEIDVSQGRQLVSEAISSAR